MPDGLHLQERGDPLGSLGRAIVEPVEAGVSNAGRSPRDALDAVGGGPYNTARAIGRLGVPVRWIGGLSSDRFGRELEAGLVAELAGGRRLVELEGGEWGWLYALPDSSPDGSAG